MSPEDVTGGAPMLTNMEEAVAMVHELYVTLQRAGFNQNEAFQLVSNLLTGLMLSGAHLPNGPSSGA